MLAERAMEWTREWKEEGRQEGLQEGRLQAVLALRDILLSVLTDRFGSVPTPVRRRVTATRDFDRLAKLGKQLLAASSLDELIQARGQVSPLPGRVDSGGPGEGPGVRAPRNAARTRSSETRSGTSVTS